MDVMGKDGAPRVRISLFSTCEAEIRRRVSLSRGPNNPGRARWNGVFLIKWERRTRTAGSQRILIRLLSERLRGELRSMCFRCEGRSDVKNMSKTWDKGENQSQLGVCHSWKARKSLRKNPVAKNPWTSLVSVVRGKGSSGNLGAKTYAV